jgi:hypothetical protein
MSNHTHVVLCVDKEVAVLINGRSDKALPSTLPMHVVESKVSTWNMSISI